MKYQRQKEILQYINEAGSARITELLERFDISKATLNRDLTDLEKGGALKKVHGGVVSNLAFQTFEPPINQKELQNKSYKEAMARIAVREILSNQAVILDSGSTIWYLAKELARRDDVENLTVITNDLKIAYTLAECENISLFVLGGMRLPEAYDLYSSQAVEVLRSLNADVYFMAGAAFDGRAGITHTSMEDTEMKKEMMKCSKRSVLCIDSSKYNITKRWSICGLDDLDEIITDARLEEESRRMLEGRCSKVIFA